MRRRTVLKGLGLAGAMSYTVGASYLILDGDSEEDPPAYDERLEEIEPEEFHERLGAKEGDQRYDELYDVYRDGEIDDRDLQLYHRIRNNEDNFMEVWALQVHQRSVAQYRESENV
jgi:hypothetical protein